MMGGLQTEWKIWSCKCLAFSTYFPPGELRDKTSPDWGMTTKVTKNGGEMKTNERMRGEVEKYDEKE